MVCTLGRRGWMVAAVSMAAVGGLLAGCGSSSHSASSATSTGSTGSSGSTGSAGSAAKTGSAGGSITLYNGQHQQTTQALVAAFERQTGIHVNERDGEEAGLTQQVEQESSATKADVIFTENSPSLMELQEKG